MIGGPVPLSGHSLVPECVRVNTGCDFIEALLDSKGIGLFVFRPCLVSLSQGHTGWGSRAATLPLLCNACISLVGEFLRLEVLVCRSMPRSRLRLWKLLCSSRSINFVHVCIGCTAEFWEEA